jgi:pimeloyl-ACP methyl ester carboxylesterase
MLSCDLIQAKTKAMKQQIFITHPPLTPISAVSTLLATTLLLFQGCAPQPATLTPDKFPEELVHVQAKDGIPNGGVIFTPPKNSAKPIAIIWIHGWGTNFYSPTYVTIGRDLAERRYTCITGNTRMHDLGNVQWIGDKRIRGGGYWGVASEQVRDIAAWIDFADPTNASFRRGAW